MMTCARMAKTIVIRQCDSCNRQMSATDNFCRLCGAHQSDKPVTAINNPGGSDFETRTLQSDLQIHQSLSGLLLNALNRDVASKTASLRLNRFGGIALALLVAVPMWLLIILLSPLDAYMSARTASRQIDIQ